MEIRITGNKSKVVQKLIFDMVDVLEAVGIPIQNLKVPRKQRSLEKMAMACLAVGQIKKSFKEAKSTEDGIFLRTRDIIDFENANYGEKISPGSYDDIRRKDLLLPVEQMLVLRSASIESQATNNPSRGYALSPSFASLLKDFGTRKWKKHLVSFKKETKALKEELERKRALEKIPVVMPDGVELQLSAGEHNILQKAIIEGFLPLFGMGAEILYIGDTSDKFLFLKQDKLTEIGYFAVEHEELPDVIAYSQEKNILFLIEAYHSTGQWSEIRVKKIRERLSDCKANIVYITAFESLESFRRKAAEIAWETEVWVADFPEHLIHFNGYKFLEIHK